MPTSGRSNGGALLAVLWLSAALSAIAFTIAGTVRGETERVSTAADGARAYFLATGAIERAILHMLWGPHHRWPDGRSRYWEPWMPTLRFSFPSGEALVEILPASSRLDVNRATPEDLHRLLLALGVDPERAMAITLGIVDWRSPAPAGRPSAFDAYYLSLQPSFLARHASLEETEELLLIRGMTPELFYGSFERDREGRLIPRPGLRDCVSVYGVTDRFDANTAEMPLLVAAGVPPDVAASLVSLRRAEPFRSLEQIGKLFPGAPGLGRLRVGGGSIFTLRATARLRLEGGRSSDLRRSVAATVKFQEPGMDPPFNVLRWHDNAPAAREEF